MIDVGESIESTGCKELYDLLENCIDKHNRDWKKCQSELKNLSNCLYEKR